MGYVYRYTDLADNIIKYVGIVWSQNRTLMERIKEHEMKDEWCKVRRWKIEYIKENINTRTDAEYFESHYISLYCTDKYFNIKKAGWGVSSYLPNRENDWIEYTQELEINVKQQNLLDIQQKINKENMKYEYLVERNLKLQSEFDEVRVSEQYEKSKLIYTLKELEDAVRRKEVELQELQNVEYLIHKYSDKKYFAKQIVSEMDSYIFSNYKKDKDMSLRFLEVRNRIVNKFLNLDLCNDTYMIYEKDIIARMNRRSNSIPIKITCYYKGEKQYDKQYSSIALCAKDTNLSSSNLSRALKKNQIICHNEDNGFIMLWDNHMFEWCNRKYSSYDFVYVVSQLPISEDNKERSYKNLAS